MHRKASDLKSEALNFAMNYLLAFFAALFSLKLSQRTHSGPETNSEDKHPETIPNAIGIANVRSVVSP